jgi:hypothetical protein
MSYIAKENSLKDIGTCNFYFMKTKISMRNNNGWLEVDESFS